MIEAKDLRIGNYLEHPYSNGYCQVNTIDNEHLNIGEGNVIEDINDFKPIPLTEEWLIKFGFKELKRNVWFISDKDGFQIILENSIFRLKYLRKHIKYVHQLQNLYFALTGEELTK